MWPAFYPLLIHLGAHQFKSPSTFISDGTSRALTTVLSRNIASAIPSPSAFMIMMSPKVNNPATNINTRAALVMIRPVFSNPNATLDALSPDSS